MILFLLQNKISKIGNTKLNYVSLFLSKEIVEEGYIPAFIEHVLNDIFCLYYPATKKEFMKEYRNTEIINKENYKVEKHLFEENTLILTYLGRRYLTIKFDKNEE